MKKILNAAVLTAAVVAYPAAAQLPALPLDLEGIVGGLGGELPALPGLGELPGAPGELPLPGLEELPGVGELPELAAPDLGGLENYVFNVVGLAMIHVNNPRALPKSVVYSTLPFVTPYSPVDEVLDPVLSLVFP